MSSFLGNISTKVEDVIGQTLIGGTSGSSRDSNRIPMSFTSTKRLREISANFNVNAFASNEFTAESKEEAEKYLSLFKENTRVQSNYPVIQMAVNPNSISWKQPKRITKRDTQEGSIFFHFTNARGQNNDILVLDFRGNTGNIDRMSDINSVGSDKNGESTGATRKLLLWHNLWDLTREQILLNDNTLNEFLITYTSQAMPVEIMLIGFFSANLEWTDTAEKPNSRDYTFSFTVQKIIPDIDKITEEIQTYYANPPTVVP